jgi:hypothetical protein
MSAQTELTNACVGLVLQRQLPSSQVPRFNPHPPMEPPKEKKKTLEIEPISPIKVSFPVT